jgi:hypothetical protein
MNPDHKPPGKPQRAAAPALLALTASALAIPGMSAHAQGADEAMPTQRDDSLLDYRFSAYREGNIHGDKTSSGQDSQRYDVDSHQFRAATRLGPKSDLSADVTVETMSGASPWFVIPNAKGQPVQVMSGASIHDFRQALQLRGEHRFDGFSASLLGGFSSERDFRAVNGGAEASRDFNHKLTTVSGGVGYTHDVLQPTDGNSARFPARIAHADNYQLNGFAGLSQVLGPETVLQTSLSFTYDNGYLSDPYKLAYVAGNTVNDSRPGNRRRLAWTTRLRQNIRPLDASVHLDYRLYSDDWGITAHSLDLAWYQTLPWGVDVVPRLRWYTQSQADFYQPYYNAAQSNGLYSSDYRLSPFGALSESLGVYKGWRGWDLSLKYEHYDSGKAYSIRSIEVENPALVRYQVYSLSIAKTF